MCIMSFLQILADIGGVVEGWGRVFENTKYTDSILYEAKDKERERIPWFLTVVSFATTPTEFSNNYFGLDVDVAKKKDQSGTAIIADERRTEKN